MVDDQTDDERKIEEIVRICLESREQPVEVQAAYLRDRILTLIDPMMNIVGRIRFNTIKGVSNSEGK